MNAKDFAVKGLCFLLSVIFVDAKLNLTFVETFDRLDTDIWTREISAWGGGNNEFQVYTDDKTNSYVQDNTLFIKPSILVNNTNPKTGLPFGEAFLRTGTMNLQALYAKCTNRKFEGCKREAAKNGIPPIMSAKLFSKKSFTFKYGRLEVEAKLPKGDWIWPAVWLLSEKQQYGIWPRSGEIDVIESRGNKDLKSSKTGESYGRDTVGSTIHFGAAWNDKYQIGTWKKRTNPDFTSAFHTYAMDWTEAGFKFFIDEDEILRIPEKSKPFDSYWDYCMKNGGFWSTNETFWKTGSKMTPFDQKFYLVLNVAVGGTGGYFPADGINHGGARPMPWNLTDGRKEAMESFWNSRTDWLSTWEDPAMQVRSIKVFEDDGVPATSDSTSNTNDASYMYICFVFQLILAFLLT
ncbi:beta-1,3-glucan-binding protein-like [Lineus longissimus]|uniref:beta-1,3-glucan-binding protein-like n=1 Tax=Lineus longissimus TaxID=88925 RepID=UPI00315DE19F